MPSKQGVATGRVLEQLGKLPSSRFMGSKSAILPFIFEHLNRLEFESALDAFAGSASVSYLLKAMGKRVVSNDFMSFSFHTARSIVENSGTRLSQADVDSLLRLNPRADDFVQRTFRGLYFTDSENSLLDAIIANANELASPLKRSIALAAATRACLRRRPRGIFTYTGLRYDDGRRHLRMSLEALFREAVDEINAAVFSNGKRNKAYNLDIAEVPSVADVDLVYFDPPYVSPLSDNDYIRRYHFVEGLSRYWQGLDIQEHTKTKKFRRYPSKFDSRKTVYEGFEELFCRFRNSIIVVSYSSNGIPSRDELEAMLAKYKRTTVHEVDHRYSFGTHKHKVGANKNEVVEYLFVGV
ncbi:MAG: DNA adenine methylase [Phycisphaerales bacterium JB060]